MRKMFLLEMYERLNLLFTIPQNSQTTSVTRIGGPGGLLKVRVEIDKLGDLKMKVSNLFNGQKGIG